MAKTDKAASGNAQVYKKGQVTRDGANFNDQWARKLKDRKEVPAQPADGDKPATEAVPAKAAKQIFIDEFQHIWPDLEVAERDKILGEMYEACLAAVD